ncbi:MAG TPA: ABC transporter ATP-binding protein [Firmicutes bacterium]|nr:ABC transporter ATP-binding protein [Bacillota bacterium]
MIKAQNLTKSFEDIVALDNLDITIDRGSLYGLVGSNGSGKSTLLRLIAGVYRPDGGTVTVDGSPVFEDTAVKDRIFFLSDDLYFLHKATVDEMAAFYRGIYDRFDMEKYRKIKSVFPIDTTKRIANFSKGMKRQAAILLALSSCPDYLLLDEAFDGLDPVIRLLVKRLVMDEIADRQMTVIATSHNLRELEDMCDQVGLLHKGRVLFQRDLDELKLGFCKVQAVFDGPAPDWKTIGLSILQARQQGSIHSLLVRGNAQEILAVLQTQPGSVFCEAIPMTLEEVFIGEMEAVGYDYSNILF